MRLIVSAILIANALRYSLWHVLTRDHSFTCQPYVCPLNGMSHLAFTPQPQSMITALWSVVTSRPAEGRRLSWPRRLVTYRGGMPFRRRLPIQVLIELDLE